MHTLQPARFKPGVTAASLPPAVASSDAYTGAARLRGMCRRRAAL